MIFGLLVASNRSVTTTRTGIQLRSVICSTAKSVALELSFRLPFPLMAKFDYSLAVLVFVATQWIDIAVLTNQPRRCALYQAESQVNKHQLQLDCCFNVRFRKTQNVRFRKTQNGIVVLEFRRAFTRDNLSHPVFLACSMCRGRMSKVVGTASRRPPGSLHNRRQVRFFCLSGCLPAFTSGGYWLAPKLHSHEC